MLDRWKQRAKPSVNYGVKEYLATEPHANWALSGIRLGCSTETKANVSTGQHTCETKTWQRSSICCSKKERRLSKSQLSWDAQNKRLKDSRNACEKRS